MQPTLHWILLKNTPILKQLTLEEQLLRTDSRNFCIVNIGSPKAIVMGISSDPKELLVLEKLKENPIPVIRRFSGGGTVCIDEKTLFITFIFAKDALAIDAFPEPIHRWMEGLYQAAWNIPGFHFRENDYVIHEKKCGGNAQYIKKDRWLHHTSFLFDFDEKNMDYLRLPSKRPLYRKDRSHADFLIRLSSFYPTEEPLLALLKKELVKRLYIAPFDVNSLNDLPHRRSTRIETY